MWASMALLRTLPSLLTVPLTAMSASRRAGEAPRQAGDVISLVGKWSAAVGAAIAHPRGEARGRRYPHRRRGPGSRCWPDDQGSRFGAHGLGAAPHVWASRASSSIPGCKRPHPCRGKSHSSQEKRAAQFLSRELSEGVCPLTSKADPRLLGARSESEDDLARVVASARERCGRRSPGQSRSSWRRGSTPPQPAKCIAQLSSGDNGNQ